ncbi:MAG: hypothetical protein ACRD3S_12215, partial [Terracidiphilus sp.]
DDSAKTHPALLPWSDLPDDERKKDRDTVAGIPGQAAIAGFVIAEIDPKPNAPASAVGSQPLTQIPPDTADTCAHHVADP